ncbi:hypothetical protein BXT84_14490 [Sulfobacillus thermotolerans]|uniref:Helicase XPB/Ssl2 N-terminal domain-containing protein n=1 Tax=Sulfobacillus thermotolerans TaxID=338644 RepID=A0ABM6RU40_9FIRM|nr:hypothetical protein BXT84_14490 [Sulfobacillus thermotolerans]
MSVTSLVGILDRLDPQTLYRLFEQYHLSQQDLFGWLLNPVRVDDVMHTFSPDELADLRSYLLQAEHMRSPLSKLAHGRNLAKNLGETLIAFTLRDTYARDVIPFDYFPLLLPHVFELPKTLRSAERSPRNAPTYGFEALLPLFHLVTEARREPLPQTNSGQLYRRTIGKMRKVLPPWISAEMLDSAANLAYYFRLVTLSGDGSLVATSEATNFFSHPTPQILSFIMQWALDHHNLFLVVITALAAVLDPDEWLDTQAVLKWGKALKIPGAYDSYSLEYSLTSLIAAGIWENHGRFLGRLTDAYYYGGFRQQLLAEKERTLLIEPTGDVLAPPETSPYVLWTISSMAQLVKYDLMTVYHIDRPAISQAVMQQWDATTYLADLRHMARVDIPTNLQHNIQDWFKQLTRHRLLHATLLHSEDTKDSVAAEKILQHFVIARLSPTDLIVRADNRKALFKALEQSGVPVIPHIEEYDDPDDLAYDDFLTTPFDSTLHRALVRALRGQQWVVIQHIGDKNPVRLLPIHITLMNVEGVLENRDIVTIPLPDIQTVEVVPS